MLDCPIELELYCYEIDDKIVVLDVQSSTFFTVDKLTNRILDLADEYLTIDIIEKLSEEFPEKEIVERLNQLEELWNKDKLNPPDRFMKTIDQFSNYILKLPSTSQCNLNCKYCFSNDVYRKDNKEIPLETAKDAVDFLVEEFGSEGYSYKVDLSGAGEALLRFDFVKEMNDYCRKLSEEIQKRILVTLCTNGILLDEEKSSYLKQNKILYGISIDGGEVINDDVRLYESGEGTYKDIINNCKQIRDKEYLGFAVTLTGKYPRVKDIFLDLFNLGFADSISIKPVRFPPNDEFSINEDNIEEIKKGYNELALFLIEETIKGNTEYLYSILTGDDYFGKFLKRTIREEKVIYRCSAGLNSFSVNAEGEMYLCAVGLNKEAFKIGNIYEGVDKEKQQVLRNLYADNIRYCKGCWARYFCSGECFIVGETIHGQMDRPYRVMCEYKKHLIRLSMYSWTKVKEGNRDIFEAIYEVCKERKW